MLNLSAVTDDLDIATKEYVDSHGGGSGSGVSIVRLWEAPSLSSFSAQTVTFSGSWDAYIISFIPRSDYGAYASVVFPADNNTRSFGTPYGSTICYRSATCSSNSITFSNGNGGSNYCLPGHIWGIKYAPDSGTNPDVDWTQSTYANGYYMRRGKMVSVVCESFGSITAPNNSYATVFTLPDGFRPILPAGKPLFGSCSPLGAAYPVTWKIESDGKVSVGGNGTSPNYWAFSTTFPCE